MSWLTPLFSDYHKDYARYVHGRIYPSDLTVQQLAAIVYLRRIFLRKWRRWAEAESLELIRRETETYEEAWADAKAGRKWQIKTIKTMKPLPADAVKWISAKEDIQPIKAQYETTQVRYWGTACD